MDGSAPHPHPTLWGAVGSPHRDPLRGGPPGRLLLSSPNKEEPKGNLQNGPKNNEQQEGGPPNMAPEMNRRKGNLSPAIPFLRRVVIFPPSPVVGCGSPPPALWGGCGCPPSPSRGVPPHTGVVGSFPAWGGLWVSPRFPPAALACAGQGRVVDDGGRDALAPHLIEDPQGLREVPALLASAGQG